MNKIYYLIISTILINIFGTGLLNAQILVTDRPDQTESSVTVPKGSLQWESGFWFEKDSKSLISVDQQVNSTGFNSSLLRYGITQKIELRLGVNVVNTHVLYNRMGLLETITLNTDLEPVYTGLKIKLVDESGFIPELAILGHFSIPKLSTQKDVNIESDITLAASYTLNQSLGLGINMGSHWSGNGIEYQDWFYSAVLSISHGEKLSSFWEVYSWDYELIGGKDIRADAGITYLLESNFQLDLSTGLGLSEYNPDFFISGGFSWRIPQ